MSHLFLTDLVYSSGYQDLKLKFYDLMIQQALHQSAYLDVAKYYEKVWDTPSIKEDESKSRAVSILDDPSCKSFYRRTLGSRTHRILRCSCVP